MADLAHQLRLEADPEDLTEWCGHNESTLQMLGMFTQSSDRVPPPQHIAFIHKNGL